MKKNYIYFLIIANLLFGHTAIVSAQLQTFDFSGNNASSYQCFDKDTGENLTDSDGTTKLTVNGPDDFGNFFCCADNSVSGKSCTNPDALIIAQIKPPALQQIEVWFVRILYAVWGLVASLSFLLVVKLGYDYMISRGDPTKITEVRKRIMNYLLGFALVFLAVPILTTVFRLLGVNQNAQCYNVNMPGFQFFFTSLCTDPKGVIASKFAAAPCQAFQDGNEPEGVICKGNEGLIKGCGFLGGAYEITLSCLVQEGDSPGAPTWCKKQELTLPFIGYLCSSTCNPSDC